MEELPLIAYTVAGKDGSTRQPPLRIVPAPAQRDWIAATDEGFARRCLPLVVANQSEWWILNNRPFTAQWLGNRGTSSLKVDYEDGREPDGPAFSNFGHGILTFEIPFLFRTPPGWNLLVHGPTNLPKDGATALSGLIETDWFGSFFTMNWQLTRPHLKVHFAAGEPICALLPQRRGEPSRFRPELRPLTGSPAQPEYDAFTESRDRFAEERLVPGTPAFAQKWQRHYLRGTDQEGNRFAEHQRRIKLHPFSESAD
ncbi:hypothetical protein P3T37_000647 [Kitasatospora sp. MAA4]|uniref:DUF6065 family protein n=1 Tax=Kitasatospora sp. MAA4 TaxID=3035093 RepID=UPI0024755082|nr:DUF6065 family protein [Kitasatospora sp. MAA4]MDH6131278.1 hypothetical protein [Kitasatospora sp. MAA4]